MYNLNFFLLSSAKLHITQVSVVNNLREKNQDYYTAFFVWQRFKGCDVNRLWNCLNKETNGDLFLNRILNKSTPLKRYYIQDRAIGLPTKDESVSILNSIYLFDCLLND